MTDVFITTAVLINVLIYNAVPLSLALVMEIHRVYQLPSFWLVPISKGTSFSCLERTSSLGAALKNSPSVVGRNGKMLGYSMAMACIFKMSSADWVRRHLAAASW